MNGADGATKQQNTAIFGNKSSNNNQPGGSPSSQYDNAPPAFESTFNRSIMANNNIFDKKKIQQEHREMGATFHDFGGLTPSAMLSRKQ